MWLIAWINSLRPFVKPTNPVSRLYRRHPRSRRLYSPEVLEDRALLSATASNVLLFSLEGGSALGSLPNVGTFNGNDILSYDGSQFGMYFQGDDVGLSSADIDAFALISPNEILMSFSSSVTISGLGTVDGSDIVLFSATSLGANTAGSFSLFFDGSQFGLGSAANANVDALEYLDNGHLLISTVGDFSVSSGGGTLSFSDEDILEFTPSGPGPVTGGTWSLYFDGSDVALTFASEDVDGLAVDANGTLLLSTVGSFFGTTFGGDNEDVVEFTPTSLGSNTSGSFVQPLFFDGSAVNTVLTPLNIDAFDLLTIAPPQNNAPTADTQSVSTNEGAGVSIQLTGDDGDANEVQPLTFSIISGPAHGTLSGFDPATGRVIYTPDAGYFGPDSFTFAVTDNPSAGGSLSSSPAAVNIGVNAVNDPPTADSQSASTGEDQSISIQLTGDDGDSNQTQSIFFTIVSGPSHGTITGFNAATGQLLYTPDADYNGSDSFTFMVTDGPSSGGSLNSGTATVTVNIAAVNDPPTLTAPSGEQQGNAGEILTINGISVSDVDTQQGNGILELRLTVQSGQLTVNANAAGIQSVTGNGTGAIVLRGTQAGLNAVLGAGVQYAGNEGFDGVDSLSVTVNDLGNFGSGGAQSASRQVGIRINADDSEGEPLDLLRAEVQELIDSGELPAKFGTPLLRKLDLQGNKMDALRLKAFILETHALRLCGYLDRDQAESLISQAREILNDLPSDGCWRPCGHHRGWSGHHFKSQAIDHIFSNSNRLFDAMARTACRGR